MGSCQTNDVLTLGQVRSFLQIPDARNCGRKTLYYGKDCQLMEVDGVQRNVRNSSSPIRTWSRRTKSFCTIGNNESPPDISQLTIRFYEQCNRGVPLPHTLGQCRVRVINNYGLCKSDGTIATGWSSYAEVLDVQILSENRGKRSSYDGSDDTLVDELTVELLNIYDVSTVQFTKIDLTGIVCGAAGNIVANSAAFGCNTGCGGRSCSCPEPCDDGTQAIYIAASCAGSTSAQYIISSRDGGENTTQYVLPAPSAGGTAATYPKTAVIGTTLYVLAYQNPTTLFSIQLDEKSIPTGSWQEVSVLTGNDGLITTGIPGELVADGDTLHILVNDTANGSRYYTLGGNRTPDDGERYTFPAAANMARMAACGDQIVVVGDSSAIYQSQDGGSSFTAVTAPTALGTTTITAVRIADGRIWIGAANGLKFQTNDDGLTWTQMKISGATGTANDIVFSGDDIGWIADSSGSPLSTWLGGTQKDEWTRQTNRVYNWPSTVTPKSIVLPTCADTHLAANTLLVLGTDAAGATVAYIGRDILTGT
ncbi:MAG TPA: hypothetical protein PLJ74_10545 [Myxococcota bacterium]|nr:hypothetical protein [Myxococcota bacterium]